MNSKFIPAGFALMVSLGSAAVIRGQVTPYASTPVAPQTRTPAPTMTRNPSLYSIPPTTPVGMPAYSTPVSPSPLASAAGAGARPMSPSDCSGSGWRNYRALEFKSQKNCEDWLKRHPARAKAPGIRTRSRKSASARGQTPRPTVAAAGSAPAETPGPSLTPGLHRTPY